MIDSIGELAESKGIPDWPMWCTFAALGMLFYLLEIIYRIL